MEGETFAKYASMTMTKKTDMIIDNTTTNNNNNATTSSSTLSTTQPKSSSPFPFQTMKRHEDVVGYNKRQRDNSYNTTTHNLTHSNPNCYKGGGMEMEEESTIWNPDDIQNHQNQTSATAAATTKR